MDVTAFLKAIVGSPQVLGILISAAGVAIHNTFAKAAPPKAASKSYLQIAYLVLSGGAMLLKMYMDGSLGSISAADIQAFLNVWMSALAAHFAGGALVQHQIKPFIAARKARAIKG